MSKLENQENGEPKKGKPRGTPFQKGNKFGCGSKQKKESLSLPNYIKRKTNQGKILTNFYIGVLKTVEDNNTDDVPTYKGMKVTPELSNKAVDWLGKNGWGTPSQRKPEDDKPKRTLDELKHRFRFLVKKVFKKEENIKKIYAILDDEGL